MIGFGQVLINEYSGANYDTYTDNYGEYQDWVELYNPTTAAIDINGWALSDKVSNPLKWMIPSSFIVPANGTAIVYCSGRDELVGGNAHSSLPEQKTIAVPFAGTIKEDGTTHLLGLVTLSDKYQPLISIAAAVGL